MFIKIIAETKDFWVIDKPAGLVVTRAPSVRGLTLQDWVEENVQMFKCSNVRNDKEFRQRSGIVHRLDKETSGLLLIAKNPAAFVCLKDQFKQRQVEKTYLALVHGRVTPGQGDINQPLARRRGGGGRFGVSLAGRRAVTFYQVLVYYSGFGQQYSYIELKPRTGRTHQLRVHCHHLGHVLVADPLYAAKKTLLADRRWCPRLFLHASQLMFNDPSSQKRRQFTLDLPVDLTTAKEQLKDEKNQQV